MRDDSGLSQIAACKRLNTLSAFLLLSGVTLGAWFPCVFSLKNRQELTQPGHRLGGLGRPVLRSPGLGPEQKGSQPSPQSPCSVPAPAPRSLPNHFRFSLPQFTLDDQPLCSERQPPSGCGLTWSVCRQCPRCGGFLGVQVTDSWLFGGESPGFSRADALSHGAGLRLPV